jgi:hypothetical protein
MFAKALIWEKDIYCSHKGTKAISIGEISSYKNVRKTFS